MNKKVLSLVLALAIVLGSFGTVALASNDDVAYNSQAQKIQWLIDNNHVEGRKVNEDGSADLALEDNVTRAEITKLLVHILGQKDLAEVLDGVMRPFPDVTIEHWANGYISVATTNRPHAVNENRIVIGFPDGNFYPENNVTYAELATMLVRIVKDDLTTKMEANSIWATSYMRWAEEEGILEGLTITNSDAPSNRADAFEMIYNAFFKMGGVNEYDFGSDLGIVSRLGNGTIQLNQDADKVYKIDANTLLTDGTTWRSLSANLDAPLRGSLVRLIVKDGVVTHLIELGNPRRLALDESRWFGVAENTVEGTATFVVDSNNRYVDISIADANNAFRPVNAEINNTTRIFVSDVNKNALTEVDSVAEAFNLMQINGRTANNVYMGYNTAAGINTAKVIVFTEVENYFGERAIVRVTGDLNSALRFEGENTKGTKTVYNVSDLPLFPSTDLLDPMDVVEITDNTNIQNRNELIKIDASKFNVYRVVSVSGRTVTLADVDGFTSTRELSRDLMVFLEGQLVAGAHVQLDTNGVAGEVVEIVSVVDYALRGAIPGGTYQRTAQGYIVNVIENPVGSEYFGTARISSTLNGSVITEYQVNENDYNLLRNADGINYDQLLRFDVREERGGVKVAYNFNLTDAILNNWAEVVLAQRALNNFVNNGTAFATELANIDGALAAATTPEATAQITAIRQQLFVEQYNREIDAYANSTAGPNVDVYNRLLTQARETITDPVVRQSMINRIEAIHQAKLADQ